MKRFLTMLLALCLLGGGSALADELKADTDTGSTSVTYTIEENTDYIVRIPAAVALTPENTTGSLAITISAPDFNVANHYVSVKLSGSDNFVPDAAAGNGSGQFYLINGSERIPYGIKMQSGFDAYVGNAVADWDYDTDKLTEKTFTLTVTANPPAGVLPAGAYTDRLTFTASVLDKSNPDAP